MYKLRRLGMIAIVFSMMPPHQRVGVGSGQAQRS